MLKNERFIGARGMELLSCLAIFLLMLTTTAMWAQSTVATGSIQGTIEDPNGAVVSGAAITITNKANGQALKLTSSSTGNYASGALQPGTYEVRVTAKGFRTEVLTVASQVGVITSGNVKLAVGEATQVVEVTGSAVAVNTQQATVQCLLSTEPLENLALKGRTFLELAHPY